jgi:hypothetical protein
MIAGRRCACGWARGRRSRYLGLCMFGLGNCRIHCWSMADYGLVASVHHMAYGICYEWQRHERKQWT